MIRCFVGLGSNLDDPRRHVEQAVADLAAHPSLQIGAISPLYRNPAIGPGEQPDYVNAVIELFTGLPAIALLRALQRIENRHGRVRTLRWGARTLDLDLLLYGDQVIDTPELSVPHPRMRERNFVLYPLFAIAPELRLPDGGSLRALLDCCPDQGLQRL